MERGSFEPPEAQRKISFRYVENRSLAWEEMWLEWLHKEGLGKAREWLEVRHEEGRIAVKYQATSRYRLNLMLVFRPKRITNLPIEYARSIKILKKCLGNQKLYEGKRRLHYNSNPYFSQGTCRAPTGFSGIRIQGICLSLRLHVRSRTWVSCQGVMNGESPPRANLAHPF